MNTAHNTADLPPMLQQYLDYKIKYPDCLLLFQVGDFYELFFEDAVTVARTLNLTLTSRDKNNPNPIPMCGVPIGVAESYIERLVQAKFSVAVVSQAPAIEVKGKQVINRHLERIITPAIRLLSQNPQDASENYVAAVYYQSDLDVALAFSHVQSGTIRVRENLTIHTLFAELQRIQPIEVIIPSMVASQKVDRRITWVGEIERALPNAALKIRLLPDMLADLACTLATASRDVNSLKGYSSLDVSTKKATKLLLAYIDETTVNVQIPIREICRETYSDLMSIDATTRRNLELVQNLKDGSQEGTLYSVLNRSVTAGGARLLRQWVMNPLVTLERILERQEIVGLLLRDFESRRSLLGVLKYVADLERLAARIELGVILPREAAALRESLKAIPTITTIVSALQASASNTIFNELNNLSAPKVGDGRTLEEYLSAILADNPEPVLTQGGIIRQGYNEELDHLLEIRGKGSSWIAELEQCEKQRTAIASLKIKYNNVLGYFIEVTSVNASKVPDDYIRRQSTANSERFTTHELRAREKDLVNAEAKQIALERKLFDELRQELSAHAAHIRSIGEVISKLDVLQALADISEREDLVRPEVDESADLIIEKGKHPVLMQLLKSSYVPTDLQMQAAEKNFLVITGPNMGGKSTYLRQAALITIMAQMGCFVPALKARIGIVDKIFARLGASDNQREGESTFMVEMREASHILAQAGSRSLLLIDEIGRGTATADGLSIAQAILEWIVLKIGSRSLFATHYHELTGLEHTLERLANYSVASYEKDDDVIFTHQIVKGPANRSYGLEVAKLAGLPGDLLARAGQLLKSSAQADREVIDSKQLSIFSQPIFVEQDNKELEDLKRFKDKVACCNINDMTPIEALNYLNKLVQEAQ